jgi:hypothetical protein
MCVCVRVRGRADVTGSMRSWLPSVKGNVVGIANALMSSLKESYPSLKLHMRFAALGFRDVLDPSAPQFEDRNFRDDPEVLCWAVLCRAGCGVRILWCLCRA